MKNINCTKQERKLLKMLKSGENSDGFWELLLMDYTPDPQFYGNFQDPSVVKTIKSIEEESKYPRALSKRFEAISQMSIKEKTLDGTASYDFIRNVADIADMAWLKPLKEKGTAKKVLVLYFFKKFENCMRKPLQSKTKLIREYQSYATKDHSESLRAFISQKENNSKKILETLIKSF